MRVAATAPGVEPELAVKADAPPEQAAGVPAFAPTLEWTIRAAAGGTLAEGEQELAEGAVDSGGEEDGSTSSGAGSAVAAALAGAAAIVATDWRGALETAAGLLPPDAEEESDAALEGYGAVPREGLPPPSALPSATPAVAAGASAASATGASAASATGASAASATGAPEGARPARVRTDAAGAGVAPAPAGEDRSSAGAAAIAPPAAPATGGRPSGAAERTFERSTRAVATADPAAKAGGGTASALESRDRPLRAGTASAGAASVDPAAAPSAPPASADEIDGTPAPQTALGEPDGPSTPTTDARSPVGIAAARVGRPESGGAEEEDRSTGRTTAPPPPPRDGVRVAGASSSQGAPAPDGPARSRGAVPPDAAGTSPERTIARDEGTSAERDATPRERIARQSRPADAPLPRAAQVPSLRGADALSLRAPAAPAPRAPDAVPSPGRQDATTAAGRRRARAAEDAAVVLGILRGRRGDPAAGADAASGSAVDPGAADSGGSERGASRPRIAATAPGGWLENETSGRSPLASGDERAVDRSGSTPTAAASGSPAEPVAPRAPVAASALAGSRTGLPTWAERIGELLKLEHSPARAEMRIELEPAGLGHLEVRLRILGGGLHASIVADHEQARTLLVQQQHLLESALQRTEIHLSQLDVDVRGDAERRQAPLPSEDGAGAPIGWSGEIEAKEGAPPLVGETRLGRISVRA